MSQRNITVQVDEEVIRIAKVIAAKRGTSVSKLVSRHLEELAREDQRYEQAMERALRAMRRGGKGGGRNWKREELHDR